MYTYYVCMCIHVYIYIYIDRYDSGFELCYSYPYPCPNEFHKLPAVLFCNTHSFYKLSWAWAWAWAQAVANGPP